MKNDLESQRLKALTKRLDKHLSVLSRERDAMRRLMREIEDVLEPTNRGVEALEESIAALSEIV